MLETPRQLHEGSYISAASSIDECFQFHRHTLTIRCQETGVVFKAAKNYFDAHSAGDRKSASAVERVINVARQGQDRSWVCAVRLSPTGCVSAGALAMSNEGLFTVQGSQIRALAARHHVPVICHLREIVEAGRLTSYGTNLADACRVAGIRFRVPAHREFCISKAVLDALILVNDRTSRTHIIADVAAEVFLPGSPRMSQPRNRVVQVSRFGGPEGLEVVDAPVPTAGRGEVRVRVLASSLEYTDVPIRRHLYAQTMYQRPPFVLGYDVVGQIDQLGDGVSGFQLGDRVADMTVLGSNASYRTLRADDLTRVPTGVDAAEAAAMILSWTTAYQLLHRAAKVKRGQHALVQGAAGAVGQALLVLGKMAGVEMWGTARSEHARVVRELGGNPIDYQREDFTRVLPGGFDIVFDGVGQDSYRRSYAALKPGGLLVAYGYSASVQSQRRLSSLLTSLARVYLWRGLLRLLPGGKRTYVYSINLMRARHPTWFKEDLERLFGLLADRTIRPRVAERISFEEIIEAHRRVEAGGLDGKLVLCPD